MTRQCNRMLTAVALNLAAASLAGASPLDARFTYQGQLLQAGNPMNGTANLSVQLFDAPSGGNAVGAVETRNSVPVSDGLFTITLNEMGAFGANAFDGSARWLEIKVNGTTLSPRQPITATPYALSLRPGAQIDGDVSGNALAVVNPNGNLNSTAIYGESAAASGLTFGVWGSAKPTGGAGVLGTADVSSNSSATGVRGISFGPAGVGVGAFATDTSGVNYAVRAGTSSPNGYAGYFTGGKSYFEGNVGVGTTAPTQKLDVNGRMRVAGGVIQDNGSPITATSDLGLYSTTGHWMRFVTNNAPFVFYSDSTNGSATTPAGGSEIFVINADGSASLDGSFGIGTPDPQFKLDVYSSGNSVARFATTDTYGSVVAFDSSGPAGGRNWSLLSSGSGNPDGAGKLIFRDVSLAHDRVTIDANGNLGIGTTSPSSRLDVDGNLTIGDSGTLGIVFRGNGEIGSDTGIGHPGNGALTFVGNGTERARVTAGGRVGIGIANPGAKLSVYSAEVGKAIWGTSTVGGSGSFGVYGDSGATDGTGIYGECSTSNLAHGVWGKSSTGYAGVFDGDVNINGTLTGDLKFFKIDHPLDPANKYLTHACVESSDIKNIYDGEATLDPAGEAWVTLPDWFEALNQDFRYQLTAIGAAAPNLHVAQRIENHRFRIAGGTPGLDVSWQVTGIRHDAYAEAHRPIVESEKPARERGRYRHPQLYGAAQEMAVGAMKSRPAEVAPQTGAQAIDGAIPPSDR